MSQANFQKAAQYLQEPCLANDIFAQIMDARIKLGKDPVLNAPILEQLLILSTKVWQVNDQSATEDFLTLIDVVRRGSVPSQLEQSLTQLISLNKEKLQQQKNTILGKFYPLLKEAKKDGYRQKLADKLRQFVEKDNPVFTIYTYDPDYAFARAQYMLYMYRFPTQRALDLLMNVSENAKNGQLLLKACRVLIRANISVLNTCGISERSLPFLNLACSSLVKMADEYEKLAEDQALLEEVPSYLALPETQSLHPATDDQALLEEVLSYLALPETQGLRPKIILPRKAGERLSDAEMLEKTYQLLQQIEYRDNHLVKIQKI